MLLADKLDIEQKLKVNMLSIELRELDFYRVNCNTIGTQAALRNSTSLSAYQKPSTTATAPRR
jgi:hypothetical protein